MIGTSPSQNQCDGFLPLLTDFSDMDHDLVRLANKIDWSLFEQEFATLYSETGKPAELIFDRGARGTKQVGEVVVTTPDPPGKSGDGNHKRRMRWRFRKRAGIEPIIGHLKSDHRMEQNYLQGGDSPYKNALLAASGWNLKKWMEQTHKKIKKALFRWCFWWLFAPSIFPNPSS